MKTKHIDNTKYEFIWNHFQGGEQGGVQHFENYGKEREFVNTFPENQIWTIIDGEHDDDLWIVAGLRHGNQSSYCISTTPWEREDEEYIWMESEYAEPKIMKCEECGNKQHFRIVPKEDIGPEVEEYEGELLYYCRNSSCGNSTKFPYTEDIWPKHSLEVRWGRDDSHYETKVEHELYVFKNNEELGAFMFGVNEAYGWDKVRFLDFE